MKAAVLKAWGSPLSVESIPIPSLGTGEVLVDVVATPVAHYAKEVFDGSRKYQLTLPAAPGCGAVGRIKAVGPDSTKLKIGDWVFCDLTVRARDDSVMPDITLQGWSARGEGGMKLQKYFQHGALAECMRIPTENAIRLGDITEAEASGWCAAVVYLVPYSGFLAADLQAGETVLVSGATGVFGSAAVAVALSMGAGCVVAAGRNEKVLAELQQKFGSRVRIAKLSGNEEADREAMKKAAPNGLIDIVLDILPPSAPSQVARAAIMAVRPYGRVVLMGGVGMLGGPGLELPYAWIMRNCITIKGQWMYTQDVPAKFVKLVQSGLLPMTHFQVTHFKLDQINEAVEHAAENAVAFKMTVINM